jgi:chromosomal replication initiation ATPase DnaA
MKHSVFNQYADIVADKFRIKTKKLFTKTKKQEIVDARYLLYYLCFNRPMQIKYIVDYMNEAGYKVYHSTVIYGISTMTKKISEDRDYQRIVKSITESATI